METSNCWEHLVRGLAGKALPMLLLVSSVVGAVIGIAILMVQKRAAHGDRLRPKPCVAGIITLFFGPQLRQLF